MRQIQASEADALFPRLLDEVEHGETVVIMRHGRPVARLIPDPESRREDVLRAIDEIKRLRKGTGSITVEEILSARDEGRR